MAHGNVEPAFLGYVASAHFFIHGAADDIAGRTFATLIVV